MLICLFNICHTYTIAQLGSNFELTTGKSRTYVKSWVLCCFTKRDEQIFQIHSAIMMYFAKRKSLTEKVKELIMKQRMA